MIFRSFFFIETLTQKRNYVLINGFILTNKSRVNYLLDEDSSASITQPLP